MEQIKITVTVIWLVSYSLCSFASGSNRDKRNNVIDTLTSYIGVKELTGNNDGVLVEKFLMAVGARKGDPWCGAFVGYSFVVNELDVPKYPARAAAWFDKNHVIPNEQAVEGDLFSLYYRKLGRIGHVGMYLKPFLNETPYIVSGEGNTNAQGSREGNQSARRYRPRGIVNSSADWINN